MNDILELIKSKSTLLTADQVIADRMSEMICEMQYAVNFSPTENLKRVAKTLQSRLYTLRNGAAARRFRITLNPVPLTVEDYEWFLRQLALLYAQYTIVVAMSEGEETVFSAVAKSTVDNLEKLNTACKYITGEFVS